MKKIKFGALLIATLPLITVISCGNNNDNNSSDNNSDNSNKKIISTNIDNLNMEKFDQQITSVQGIINNLKKGSLDSYIYKKKTYKINYNSQDKLDESIKPIKAFMEKYFPTIVHEKKSNIITTGVIDFKGEAKMNLRDEPLKFKDMPMAPKHSHWVYNCDDLYSHKGYWTRVLKSFEVPAITKLPDSYTVKTKLMPDFGYILNNNDVHNIVFKKITLRESFDMLNNKLDFENLNSKTPNREVWATSITKEDVIKRINIFIPNNGLVEKDISLEAINKDGSLKLKFGNKSKNEIILNGFKKII